MDTPCQKAFLHSSAVGAEAVDHNNRIGNNAILPCWLARNKRAFFAVDCINAMVHDCCDVIWPKLCASCWRYRQRLCTRRPQVNGAEEDQALVAANKSILVMRRVTMILVQDCMVGLDLKLARQA